jgi:hypothetical protein
MTLVCRWVFLKYSMKVDLTFVTDQTVLMARMREMSKLEKRETLLLPVTIDILATLAAVV